MWQQRFVHAGHIAYPTRRDVTALDSNSEKVKRALTNVVFDALYSYAFVNFIGGDLVDPNLVHSDAAHFPEPSMVPAGQSAD